MALNTEKCNAWVERDKKVFAPTQHLSYYPMVIKKVDQDVIYDEDDNQYIDFLSSASSLNLGSCNPIITAAVKDSWTIILNIRLLIPTAERALNMRNG